MIDHPHADLLKRCRIDRVGNTILLESDPETAKLLWFTVDLMLQVLRAFRAERITLLVDGKLFESMTLDGLQYNRKKRLQRIGKELKTVSEDS